MRRVVSLVLVLVIAPLLLCAGVDASVEEERPALRVRVVLLSASTEESDKSSVRIKLKAKLRFINAGERPLILLDREPWTNLETLSLSREDAEAGRIVFDNVHLPSIYRAPGNEWERLTRDLDKRQPPPGLTRILPPGGAWEFEWDYWWTMSKETYNYGGEVKGWNELRAKSPLWLTFSFGMWPSNVEPNVRRRGERKEFGHRLRRRWAEFGDLWLDSVGSEPVELNIKDAAPAQVAGN
jgi:hypothetical protein